MKILQLIDVATRGGAEKHTRLFSEALARAGHEVYLIHPEGPYSESYAKASESGVTVIKQASLRGNFLKARAELIDFCKREKIEFIHTHQHRADLLGVLVDKNLSIPVATTIHNQLGKDLTWRLEPIKR